MSHKYKLLAIYKKKFIKLLQFNLNAFAESH